MTKHMTLEEALRIADSGNPLMKACRSDLRHEYVDCIREALKRAVDEENYDDLK